MSMPMISEHWLPLKFIRGISCWKMKTIEECGAQSGPLFPITHVWICKMLSMWCMGFCQAFLPNSVLTTSLHQSSIVFHQQLFGYAFISLSHWSVLNLWKAVFFYRGGQAFIFLTNPPSSHHFFILPVVFRSVDCVDLEGMNCYIRSCSYGVGLTMTARWSCPLEQKLGD